MLRVCGATPRLWSLLLSLPLRVCGATPRLWSSPLSLSSSPASRLWSYSAFVESSLSPLSPASRLWSYSAFVEFPSLSLPCSAFVEPCLAVMTSYSEDNSGYFSIYLALEPSYTDSTFFAFVLATWPSDLRTPILFLAPPYFPLPSPPLSPPRLWSDPLPTPCLSLLRVCGVTSLSRLSLSLLRVCGVILSLLPVSPSSAFVE